MSDSRPNRPLKVTIAGSYRKHFDRVVQAKRAFEELGVEVIRPSSEKVVAEEVEGVRLEGDPDSARVIREAQFEAISKADLLYVVNPGGYLGATTMADLGYAHRDNTPTVTSEPPFEHDAEILVAATCPPQQAIDWIAGRDR